MDYNFEWDPKKARLNLRKHGVSFEEAATIFQYPRMLSMYDPDHSELEDRWLSLGISRSGRLLVVGHTFHEQSAEAVTVRIYSARRSTSKETRNYEEA